MSPKMKTSMPSEEELRANGYMTTDEFVERFTRGLGGYLRSNWPTKPSGLHHPEDLTSNALAYAEAAHIVIGVFGAGNTNE